MLAKQVRRRLAQTHLLLYSCFPSLLSTVHFCSNLLSDQNLHAIAVESYSHLRPRGRQGFKTSIRRTRPSLSAITPICNDCVELHSDTHSTPCPFTKLGNNLPTSSTIKHLPRILCYSDNLLVAFARSQIPKKYPTNPRAILRSL